MALKEKRLYYLRKFLNRPRYSAGAFIIAEATEQRWEHKTKRGQREEKTLQVVLEIADCYHHVNLEIDTSTVRERTNGLHKLDVLIETLTALRSAVEKWCVENPTKTRQ
jgi:hypothetical protein